MQFKNYKFGPLQYTGRYTLSATFIFKTFIETINKHVLAGQYYMVATAIGV